MMLEMEKMTLGITVQEITILSRLILMGMELEMSVIRMMMAMGLWMTRIPIRCLSIVIVVEYWMGMEMTVWIIVLMSLILSSWIEMGTELGMPVMRMMTMTGYGM